MKINPRVKILLYADNLWYFGEGMLGPLLAIFTESVGGDLLDVSWAWAIFLMVTGFMHILVGKFLDGKKLNKQFMVAGYALNAVFTFSYLFVSSPLQLFMVEAGLGIALAMATPTWNTLYSEFEDRKHDTLEWGLADGQASIVTGVAILVGGALVNYFSFSALFLIMGLIQVVSTAYVARILFVK